MHLFNTASNQRNRSRKQNHQPEASLLPVEQARHTLCAHTHTSTHIRTRTHMHTRVNTHKPKHTHKHTPGPHTHLPGSLSNGLTIASRARKTHTCSSRAHTYILTHPGCDVRTHIYPHTHTHTHAHTRTSQSHIPTHVPPIHIRGLPHAVLKSSQSAKKTGQALSTSTAHPKHLRKATWRTTTNSFDKN